MPRADRAPLEREHARRRALGAALLAHTREHLHTVPFDERVHERFDLDLLFVEMERVRAAGGGNTARRAQTARDEGPYA